VAGTQGTEIKAVHREEWLDAGACRDEDPELFFPITSSGPSARQIEAAKAVCQRCGVQDQCLHYALESHQSHGVWGGTSEEERGHMSPSRAASPRTAPREPAPTDQRPADQRPPSRRPASVRRPSRRIRSGREGRNVGYRA
jgi:WhiB family transcriptional regulator, redox-sensing transcriptional regulator